MQGVVRRGRTMVLRTRALQLRTRSTRSQNGDRIPDQSGTIFGCYLYTPESYEG